MVVTGLIRQQEVVVKIGQDRAMYTVIIKLKRKKKEKKVDLRKKGAHVRDFETNNKKM